MKRKPEQKIESVTRKVRQIELVGYGLKNTRVINRKVSLARVAFIDDAEDETPPKRRR